MVKWRFDSWLDGSKDNPRSVNVISDTDLKAIYKEVENVSYRPSASPQGTAKVRRKTALSLSPLSIDVDEGTSVSLTGALTEASGPNQGAGIEGKTVHLYVDGVDTGEMAVTGVDGSFSIDHVWGSPGDFVYEVIYDGD